MGTIGIIFLVVFILICILLVCLVLVQNEEGGGMGGLFGDANSKAFGSRSGNVLTKTTYVLVALFFVTTFVLAFLNRAPSVRQLDPSALEIKTTVEEGKSWLDEESAPVDAGAALTPAAIADESGAADAAEGE
ncbi:MAG: preprotein translocase subunit SecG [Treponema sp.]|jgi:preprotein translocase subunit SecG|nr:preprotein translocase subunit SecG [Treponema sp.]